MKHTLRWGRLMVVIALILAGCGTAALPADTKITLSRTRCYGTCPVYSITIAADGTVVYEGKDFVHTTGRVEGRLTPEQMRTLVQAFDAIDYESYRTSYESPDPAICPEFWTDSPSVRTSLTRGGRTTSVTHNLGCKGFAGERELLTLENTIDMATDKAVNQ